MSEWSVVLTLRAWRLPRLAVRRGDVLADLHAAHRTGLQWHKELKDAQSRIDLIHALVARKGDGK